MIINRMIHAFVSMSICSLLIAALMAAGLLFSCSITTDGGEPVVNYPDTDIDDAIIVDTKVVKADGFYKEIHSIGRLGAKQKLRLLIPVGGKITGMKVVNGDHVVKDQILAVICNQRINSRLERANLQLKRAVLDMEDILLGQGFVMKDSLGIPDFTWQMAGVRSGYFEVLNEISEIKNELDKTFIRAPFDGLVADLQMHPGEVAKPGDVFCAVIDMDEFLVSFRLMEQELTMIENEMSVIISPFSQPDKNYRGYLRSINPFVDEYGQVELTAVIRSAPGLLTGMHVNTSIQKKVSGQMMVPRSAVLMRDGYDVIFKYSDGRAVWTYIDILHENSTGYSVRADPNRVGSLEPGDTIIISNNLHLAHDSPVKRQSE